jgi:hypothetical protein
MGKLQTLLSTKDVLRIRVLASVQLFPVSANLVTGVVCAI